jgi:polyhydroxyalkanoate synthesis repressor PhaR
MVAVTEQELITMPRLIKRYGNRKMYDTQASRYVTLDNVAELVRSGDDLRIIDNDTGEDLTAVTFAQVIFEEAKRSNGFLGLPVLRRIIQQGGAAVQEILTSVDRGREAIGNMRELAEKGVKQLVHSAEGKRGPAHRASRQSGRGFLDEILELPQKQLEQIQHRIDLQVRNSLERVTAHPVVQNELRRIQRSIKGLERQLTRLRRGQSGGAAAKRRTVRTATDRTAAGRTAKKGVDR